MTAREREAAGFMPELIPEQLHGRLGGVLASLHMERHAEQLRQLGERYTSGGMSLEELHAAVSLACLCDGDAVRIVRAMLER